MPRNSNNHDKLIAKSYLALCSFLQFLIWTHLVVNEMYQKKGGLEAIVHVVSKFLKAFHLEYSQFLVNE